MQAKIENKKTFGCGIFWDKGFFKTENCLKNFQIVRQVIKKVESKTVSVLYKKETVSSQRSSKKSISQKFLFGDFLTASNIFFNTPINKRKKKEKILLYITYYGLSICKSHTNL